jgi:hypothetical protein
MTQTNRDAREKRAGSASPARSLDLALPYYFSGLAHRRQEDIQVGDYVQVSGLNKKFELVDILWKYGSVRVRQVGRLDSMSMPWHLVKPWKKEVIRSRTVMRALGDWLFRGNRVYLLPEPDRMLRTRKINWDRETSDVEDEHGKVYREVPWDTLEFWEPVDYHLPDDE